MMAFSKSWLLIHSPPLLAWSLARSTISFSVQLACSIEDVRQRQRIIHHLSARDKALWQLGMLLL
jgi:hypothetical protein